MLQEKKKKNTFVAENAENMQGEMLEWLKAPVPHHYRKRRSSSSPYQ